MRNSKWEEKIGEQGEENVKSERQWNLELGMRNSEKGKKNASKAERQRNWEGEKGKDSATDSHRRTQT